MPKRFVEDTIYVSDKLLSVPEEYRGEYSWVLPMAEANGCMENNPGLIWRTAYALMRPSWTMPKVTEMLGAFIEAKLLFPFTYEGKPYVYFVGIENGRLPKNSDRSKFRNSQSIVPAKELGEFLGLAPDFVEQRFRDVIASPSPSARATVAYSNGAGAGVVVGAGTGLSESAGESNSVGLAIAATAAPAHPTESPSQNSRSKGTKAGTGTQDSKAAALADHLYRLVQSNPKYDPSKTPTNWRFLWSKDIQPLLETYSFDALTRLVELSQCESQAPYNVRAEGFVKNVALLASMFKVPCLAEEAKGKKVPGKIVMKSQPVETCLLCALPEPECECEFGSMEDNDD